MAGCAQRGEAVRHKQVLLERPVLRRCLVPPYVPLPALIKRKRACVDLPIKAASMVIII